WCIVDLTGKHGRVRTVPMPSWAKVAIDGWAAAAGIREGKILRGVNKGDRLMADDSLTSQGIWRCVETHAAAIGVKVTPHDLGRSSAKLRCRGGATLDQLQLSLGDASIQTPERYLGVQQDIQDAPCDYLKLDLMSV